MPSLSHAGSETRFPPREAVRMTPQLFVIDGGDGDDEDPGAFEEFEDLPPDTASESQARSTLHGKEFDALALAFLEEMGATVVERYEVYSVHQQAMAQSAHGHHRFIRPMFDDRGRRRVA